MGVISVSLPSDGTTADVADVNTPINTIVNEFNGNIDNSNIKSSAAIATSKLAADNGISAAMLSSSAITLGYTAITTNFTTASTTVVQVTGLTVSVTIPAGSRHIKITFMAPQASAGSANTVVASIWDGTVGSGTQIASFNNTSGNGGIVCMAVVTPAAGSKTYNIGVFTTAGTATVAASATSPAFILVEAV